MGGVLAAPTPQQKSGQPSPALHPQTSPPDRADPRRGLSDAGLQLDRRSPLSLAALPPTPRSSPMALSPGGCGQSVCRLGGDLGPRKSPEEGPCGSACGPELHVPKKPGSLGPRPRTPARAHQNHWILVDEGASGVKRERSSVGSGGWWSRPDGAAQDLLQATQRAASTFPPWRPLGSEMGFLAAPLACKAVTYTSRANAL